MKLRRWLRTYSFRITLLYVALVGASVAIVFGVIYRSTGSFMEKQLRYTIRSEMASLAGDLEAVGIDDLAEIVTQRVHSVKPRFGFYLLQKPDGQKVAGNLPAMPPAAGWHELPVSAEAGGGDPSDTLMAQGQVLPNGWFLVVGRDMDQLTDFQEQILTTAGWSLAAVFALALLGGVATSAGILRRLEAITETGRDIMRGNLSRRVAMRGTDDEFDRLSGGLNEMLDRIQALMDGLRQVSNDIAHDLRTPLARLRQRLEGARLKARSPAEHQAAIEDAIAETDEILRTFGALLRIAQIETGARRAAFVEVDLSAVLETIVETYGAVAEDLRHSLVGRIARGVALQGDRQLLTQMAANLVENALRHTPEGTRIEIALEETPEGAVCRIADDGPGIPESEREKVFRRFYRLDSSRATPGSGLGLSLVAAVAELHGIAIEIGDNDPGLRVTLRVPARSGIG